MRLVSGKYLCLIILYLVSDVVILRIFYYALVCLCVYVGLHPTSRLRCNDARNANLRWCYNRESEYSDLLLTCVC